MDIKSIKERPVIDTQKVEQLLVERTLTLYGVAKEAGEINLYNNYINWKNNKGYLGRGQAARILEKVAAALDVEPGELLIKEAA